MVLGGGALLACLAVRLRSLAGASAEAGRAKMRRGAKLVSAVDSEDDDEVGDVRVTFA